MSKAGYQRWQLLTLLSALFKMSMASIYDFQSVTSWRNSGRLGDPSPHSSTAHGLPPYPPWGRCTPFRGLTPWHLKSPRSCAKWESVELCSCFEGLSTFGGSSKIGFEMDLPPVTSVSNQVIQANALFPPQSPHKFPPHTMALCRCLCLCLSLSVSVSHFMFLFSPFLAVGTALYIHENALASSSVYELDVIILHNTIDQ